ncbi:unnamed protein product [Rhizoctonia solani]|uniref:Uncharacterized protein n=1 Tax=Rhizoctonia solani TaxID=456999 RepID=A0A8H3CVC4_9AGAM|nr:unnamed protein product [Rhizoctonia solani]
MTHWAFNLRSSDSDMEDEDETVSLTHDTHLQPNDNENTRQKEIDKALEELFGTANEDEGVEYKPNPWSIAKINANARKIPPRTTPQTKTLPKPASKPSWGPYVLGQPHNEHRSIPGDTGIQAKSNFGPPPLARRRALRDSISEALRRDKSATVGSTEQEKQSLKHDRVGRGPNNRSCLLTVENTTSKDSDQLLNNPIKSQCDSLRKPSSKTHDAYNPSAYIRNKYVTIPGFDTKRTTSHPDVPVRIVSGDGWLLDEQPTSNSGMENQPAYNGGDLESPPCQVYNTTSEDGFPCNPLLLSPSSHRNDAPVNRTIDYPWEVSPELGHEWIPQDRIGLASSYCNGHPKSRLEPSLSVQSIARSATPKILIPPVASIHTEYNSHDKDCGGLPVIARTPRSPTRKETKSYTHPDTTQSHPPHTPERPPRPIQGIHLITPSPKKRMDRFDPDDKPFWSTLPTPPNSNPKPPTNGIKTSRFRLPGPFLGASPLSGSSGRVLYKPPPRKRTRSPDGEDQTRKWRVARAG